MTSSREAKTASPALDRNGRVRDRSLKRVHLNGNGPRKLQKTTTVKCMHCPSESANVHTHVCPSCREQPLCVSCSSNYVATVHCDGTPQCWPCHDRIPCDSCPSLKPHLRAKGCPPSADSPFVSGWLSQKDTPCIGNWWCHGCWWCDPPTLTAENYIECDTCCNHVLTTVPHHERWWDRWRTKDLFYCDECWQQMLQYEDEVLDTYPMVDYAHPGLHLSMRTDQDELGVQVVDSKATVIRPLATKEESDAKYAWRTRCSIGKRQWRNGAVVDPWLPPLNLLLPWQTSHICKRDIMYVLH
jgi:hypothetical protein